MTSFEYLSIFILQRFDLTNHLTIGLFPSSHLLFLNHLTDLVFNQLHRIHLYIAMTALFDPIVYGFFEVIREREIVASIRLNQSFDLSLRI